MCEESFLCEHKLCPWMKQENLPIKINVLFCIQQFLLKKIKMNEPFMFLQSSGPNQIAGLGEALENRGTISC